MTNEFRLTKFSSDPCFAATQRETLPDQPSVGARLRLNVGPVAGVFLSTFSRCRLLDCIKDDILCYLLYSLAIARAITIHFQLVETMSPKLNKKQKKQIDAARKKIGKLQQQLAGAKQQPDDPADVPMLESEIARLQHEIHKIQNA